jgi:Na+/H+-dicarboxylate symporter
MKRNLTETIVKLGIHLFLAGAIIVFVSKFDLETIRTLGDFSKVIVIILIASLIIMCVTLIIIAICRLWILLRWKKMNEHYSHIMDWIHNRFFKM